MLTNLITAISTIAAILCVLRFLPSYPATETCAGCPVILTLLILHRRRTTTARTSRREMRDIAFIVRVVPFSAQIFASQRDIRRAWLRFIRRTDETTTPAMSLSQLSSSGNALDKTPNLTLRAMDSDVDLEIRLERPALPQSRPPPLPPKESFLEVHSPHLSMQNFSPATCERASQDVEALPTDEGAVK